MHWRKMFPALMMAVALTLATSGIVFAEEAASVADTVIFCAAGRVIRPEGS